MDIILHICNKDDWSDAQFLGEYRGDAIAIEGFIHCSKPDQVIEVANVMFKGQPNLLLLVIDAEKVKAPIKYEDPGDLEPIGKLYPHIYGALNLDAVVCAKEFTQNEQGAFSLPELP